MTSAANKAFDLLSDCHNVGWPGLGNVILGDGLSLGTGKEEQARTHLR